MTTTSLVLISAPTLPLYPKAGTLSSTPPSEHPMTIPGRPSYRAAVLPAGQLIRFQLPGVFLLFFDVGLG